MTVGLSVINLIFTSVLVLALTSPALAAALAVAPLRFFGKYSYGLYVIYGLLAVPLLWVFPTPQWMALFAGWPTLGVFSLAAFKTALCVPFAVLSFHLFEERFLHLKRFFVANEHRPD